MYFFMSVYFFVFSVFKMCGIVGASRQVFLMDEGIILCISLISSGFDLINLLA